MTAVRILAIEDSEADWELLVRELRRGGLDLVAKRVDTRAEYLEALREPWDVVVLDHGVPQLRSVEVIEEISGVAPATPVIVVSGVLNEENAVAALRAGARDFISKQNFSRLLPAIAREIAASADRRELTEARRALSESEALLTWLGTGDRDVVIRCSPDLLTVEHVSPTVSELLGYSPADFYDDPTLARRIVHPDAHPRIDAADAAPPGLPSLVRLTRHDGAQIWCDRLHVPVRDADNGVVAYETRYRDVTNLVEAERAARRERSKFQAVFDGALDAMLLADDDRAYVAANAAACELLGATHDEIIGRRVEEFSPDDPTAVAESWAAFVETGAATGTYGLLRPDGTERVAEFNAKANIEPSVHLSVLRDVTERLASEQQIRDGEERFRSMVEQLPLIVFSSALTEDGTTYVSPQIEQLLGVPVEQWIESGELFWPYVHPEDRERLSEERYADRAAGDLRIAAADGSQRSMHWQHRIVRRADGTATHAQGFLVDVTELKASQEALRQSEARYRLVLESNTQMVVMLDLEGTIVYASPSVQRTLGYPPESLVGATVAEGMHPADAGTARGLVERMVAGEDAASAVVRIRHSDGRWRWIDVRLSRILGADGNTAMILSMSTDVTAQVQESAALVATEERLRIALAQGQMGLFDWDPLRGEFTLSEGLEAMLGLESGALASSTETFLEHVVPEDRERVRASLEGCLDDASVIFTYRVRRADGVVRTFETRATVYSVDGARVGVRAVVSDVSERVRAGELEMRLVQSQKMEAIGQLAGGIAHDFNNLLTVISGYGDVALERAAADSELSEILGEIRLASDRAAQLTQQLLAFSRQQVLRPEVISLNSVVEQHVNLLSRLLGETIDVRCDLQAAPSFIKADPGQIAQVIMNLAVNARDAMPLGGALTVATRQEPDTVVLEIRDTGVGIDEETRERMFDPFFTTKEPGKGTGMGLSTVQGIVEQSGGRIEVESLLDAGTTFRLFFDRAEPIDQEGRAQPVAAPVEQGDETVLLVEDDPKVRTLVSRMLTRSGYQVLLAASPSEAIEIASSGQAVDVVLTDVVMPQMSGGELAQRVAEHLPAATLVFMSGYTNDAVVAHGVASDGIVFLQKPFGAGELTAKIREALAR